ncbi:MAG TPA: response regulator [bacterium]|nr:response regulator [bacterium]
MISENERKRILIVDDESDITDYIEEILRDKYDLLRAETGGKALTILKSEKIHLILMDIAMPGDKPEKLSGLDALKAIRSNEDTAEIPVIMVTALSSREHKLAAKQAGANDYLEKPFKNDILLKKVSNLLDDPHNDF